MKSWNFTGTEAPDWDQEAIRIANLVTLENFSAHRGVVLLPAGLAAVFGNDGYSSGPQARMEVHFLRQLLRENDVDELGFGIDTIEAEIGGVGFSWAMIVKQREQEGVLTDITESEADELTRYVWQAWSSATSIEFCKGRLFQLAEQYPKVFGIDADGKPIVGASA